MDLDTTPEIKQILADAQADWSRPVSAVSPQVSAVSSPVSPPVSANPRGPPPAIPPPRQSLPPPPVQEDEPEEEEVVQAAPVRFHLTFYFAFRFFGLLFLHRMG